MPAHEGKYGREYTGSGAARTKHFLEFDRDHSTGAAHDRRVEWAGLCGEVCIGGAVDGSERAAGNPLGREFWPIDVERPMVAAVYVHVRPLWFLSHPAEHVVLAEFGGRFGTHDGPGGIQHYVSVQRTRGQRRPAGVESVACVGRSFRRNFRYRRRAWLLPGAEEGRDPREPGAAKSAQPGNFYFAESFDWGGERTY